jgi:acetolactate synthase-1/2/3 large subunit
VGFFIGPRRSAIKTERNMSRKQKSPARRNPVSSRKPTQSREVVGQPMLGSDIIIAALEREGVDTIFAYPGGASMEIHQALTRSKQIRTVLPRHEQGGVFAAEGYARVTGRAGVCMATSGPGATNLVTGLADACLDSVPVIAITGQVPQHMIGKGAFQETDIFGLTLPVVKHSYLVTSTADIPRIIKEAFYIAQTGRPGPVVIDIPKNVQQQRIVPVFPEEVHLRGYNPSPHADPASLERIIELIEGSKRPVLYVGGGLITGEASQELREFVERTQIPVTTTIMGCGVFPETHPLSLKWLGMHGTPYANWAVNGEMRPNGELVAPGADLLLALGVRFDDRVTGKVEKFCEHGTIVHIDIDASEINKNKPAHLALVSDAKFALQELNRLLAKRPLRQRFGPWHQQVAAWKAKAPLKYATTDEVLRSDYARDFISGDVSQMIMPQAVIQMLDELTQGDAIITTGVGQHQMWAGQYYNYTRPRQFITSAGLGSMGFGYPSALGAKVARPDKQVIDIDGDGSFLMNIQELATAHIEKIAAKAVVLNNQHLGMVVQWEDRFYAGNRGHTFLGDPRNTHQIYPDFVALAHGFNVAAERVLHKRDLRAALERMLAADEPYVLDVITPFTEHVLPFIPAGKTVAEMIWQS